MDGPVDSDFLQRDMIQELIGLDTLGQRNILRSILEASNLPRLVVGILQSSKKKAVRSPQGEWETCSPPRDRNPGIQTYLYCLICFNGLYMSTKQHQTTIVLLRVLDYKTRSLLSYNTMVFKG